MILFPQKKAKFVHAAFLSHEIWKSFVQKFGLPWKIVGTIEIALDENQHKILEKYLKWGPKNGISENNMELLDGNEVKKREPNVQCHSGLHCKTYVAVDYAIFTRNIKKESQKLEAWSKKMITGIPPVLI